MELFRTKGAVKAELWSDRAIENPVGSGYTQILGLTIATVDVAGGKGAVQVPARELWRLRHELCIIPALLCFLWQPLDIKAG